MCGICGSTRDGDGERTRAMNARLVHRGPDDAGVHVDADAEVALGARRLSIIDVEGGHQPVRNEDGTVWAVLNGEIYNHQALQGRLRSNGHVLRSRTDTEVLVHLYEDFGDEMVHALDGMFAFAVWDAPRRRLLIGRDRFGEKPLFYAERDGAVHFASELSALVAGLGATPEVDHAALDAYFVFGYVPGPGCLVRHVKQLSPAHTLVHDEKGTRIRRYWAPSERQATDCPIGVGEVAVALDRAVSSRMVADVPLGVFLSGGLDSTLIAALAVRHGKGRIKTFTVGYGADEVDEVDAARKTARALGTDHHELLLDDADIAERVPRLMGALDQPLADQALVALNAVSEFARSEVTVAIGGEGADELFAGYPRYRWLERAERIDGHLPSFAARGLGSFLGARDQAGLKRLGDVVSPMSTLDRHLEWVTGYRRTQRARIYGPALQRFAATPTTTLVPAPPDVGAATAAAYMRFDQRHWLPDDVLAKADRASMRASLEMRAPFLQHELAELAGRIDPKVHLQNGGKAVLRRVLDDMDVPVSSRRRKRAFSVPAAKWLRGPLQEVLRGQLRHGRMYEEGWFDRKAVAGLVDEHCAGTRDHTQTLWPLLTLGSWALQSFL